MPDECQELLRRLIQRCKERPTFVLTDSTEAATAYHEYLAVVKQMYAELLGQLQLQPHQFTDDLLRQCTELDDFSYVMNYYYPPAQIDEGHEESLSFDAMRQLAKRHLTKR